EQLALDLVARKHRGHRDRRRRGGGRGRGGQWGRGSDRGDRRGGGDGGVEPLLPLRHHRVAGEARRQRGQLRPRLFEQLLLDVEVDFADVLGRRRLRLEGKRIEDRRLLDRRRRFFERDLGSLFERDLLRRRQVEGDV